MNILQTKITLYSNRCRLLCIFGLLFSDTTECFPTFKIIWIL